MIVLHIDSSASGSASASRQLSAAAVETLRAGNEKVQVKYRDLAADPPAHLSGELLSALRPSRGNPEQARNEHRGRVDAHRNPHR